MPGIRHIQHVGDIERDRAVAGAAVAARASRSSRCSRTRSASAVKSTVPLTDRTSPRLPAVSRLCSRSHRRRWTDARRVARTSSPSRRSASAPPPPIRMSLPPLPLIVCAAAVPTRISCRRRHPRTGVSTSTVTLAGSVVSVPSGRRVGRTTAGRAVVDDRNRSRVGDETDRGETADGFEVTAVMSRARSAELVSSCRKVHSGTTVVPFAPTAVRTMSLFAVTVTLVTVRRRYPGRRCSGRR